MHELITAIRTQSIAPPTDRPLPIAEPGVAFQALTDAQLRDYVKDSDRAILLSAQDEQELGWSIVNDDCSASRERLVRANLRLVVAIAKTYAGRGGSFASLIGQGTIGLVRAVQTFDPARGARFSTWGSWWIKAAMRKMVQSGGTNLAGPQ